MSRFDVEKFATADDLARTVAGAWLKELSGRDRMSHYAVALSGGRITKGFFKFVVEMSKAQGSSWDGIHFFWADERCVPPTDTESNFLLTSDLLFKPLGIPQNQIHRIRGEISPLDASLEAEKDFRNTIPNGQFDLVFLGVGEDGHVASLFPSGEIPSNPEVCYYPVIGPKPPPQRITLSYPVLAKAKQIWILASGVGKEEVVQASLKGDETLPLGKVLKSRSKSRVFTDITITL